MASDDFEVVAFKILSYLYRCMKNGKKVDIAALRQLVGCNETYFGAVVRSLQSKGLVEGFDFDAFSGVVIDSPNIAAMSDPMITMDGAIFVSENSRMRKAKDFGIIPACAGNTLIQVALNLIDVPVARSSAVRRATIEIDRHNVDRVLIITNGWIIDDLRKNKP